MSSTRIISHSALFSIHPRMHHSDDCPRYRPQGASYTQDQQPVLGASLPEEAPRVLICQWSLSPYGVLQMAKHTMCCTTKYTCIVALTCLVSYRMIDSRKTWVTAGWYHAMHMCTIQHVSRYPMQHPSASEDIMLRHGAIVPSRSALHLGAAALQEHVVVVVAVSGSS